jgi:hypothetical protein
MLTDNSFHKKGRYFIPNTSNSISVRLEGDNNSETSLEYFIDIYEREFSINCLSVELYDELETVLPNIEDAGNEKWYNLVNGTNYVKDEVTYRFDGLLGYNKNSLISAFIYCKYLENDNSYYTTTGVKKVNKTDKSISFDPSQKYIAAYNDFLTKYQDDYTVDNYPYISNCGSFIDYYNEQDNNLIVTLETYLRDHKEDFEGYNFKKYEPLNSFGV